MLVVLLMLGGWPGVRVLVGCEGEDMRGEELLLVEEELVLLLEDLEGRGVRA